MEPRRWVPAFAGTTTPISRVRRLRTTPLSRGRRTFSLAVRSVAAIEPGNDAWFAAPLPLFHFDPILQLAILVGVHHRSIRPDCRLDRLGLGQDTDHDRVVRIADADVLDADQRRALRAV